MCVCVCGGEKKRDRGIKVHLSTLYKDKIMERILHLIIKKNRPTIVYMEPQLQLFMIKPPSIV